MVLNVAQGSHLGSAGDRFGNPNSNLLFVRLVKLAQAFQDGSLIAQLIKSGLFLFLAH